MPKSKQAQERAILGVLADGEQRTTRDIAVALDWPDGITVATRCEKMREAKIILGSSHYGYVGPGSSPDATIPRDAG